MVGRTTLIINSLREGCPHSELQMQPTGLVREEKDPHPHGFSLAKTMACFTKVQFRPHRGASMALRRQLCGRMHREVYWEKQLGVPSKVLRLNRVHGVGVFLTLPKFVIRAIFFLANGTSQQIYMSY